MNNRNNLEDVLVSVASEFTGQSQACRNELYYFFDIFIGFVDGSIRSRDQIEEQDLILRNKARGIYLKKLEENGVKVLYKESTVTVKWGKLQSTHTVRKEGRNAARTAYVSVVKKRMEKLNKVVHRWPLFSRPLEMKHYKSENQGMNSQETSQDSIALVFATDKEIKNKNIWDKWLENAPRQHYRIYSKYDHNKQDEEMNGKSKMTGSMAERVVGTMDLLHMALQEPNNKFFVLLNDG